VPPPVEEIVIGEEPSAVNAVQVVLPEQVTEVVANVPTSPPTPEYNPPCERDERRRALVIVEDAVEIKPLRNPSVVEVELPHDCGVHEKVPEPPVGHAV